MSGAAAFTGVYLALILRASAIGEAVEQLARAVWSNTAQPAGALDEALRGLLLHAGILCGAAVVGGMIGGALTRWLGAGAAPMRWPNRMIAVGGLAVGALLIRRLLALSGASHAGPATATAQRLGIELRWLGGCAVALTWAGAAIEIILLRRTQPAAVEDDGQAAGRRAQSAERRRRRAEVLQPGK